MKKTKQSSTPLPSLPRDMLTEIMSRVGANSRYDVSNCVLTYEELIDDADDPLILKSLELRILVQTPLLAVENFQVLMEKCLLHSNHVAHYVKGVLEYFMNDNTDEGLHHLLQAANASMNEAIYLCGIIKLCIGDFDGGKQFINILDWFSDKTFVDHCWKNIKVFLHGIGVLRKPEYIISLWNMQPPFVCNLNDYDNTCPKCFYYKQMY